MIKIDRSKFIEPSVLVKNNSSLTGERKMVIDYFENGGAKVKFKLYKRSSVQTTIRKIFNEKCAYCEGKFNKNSYGHIEHWRPKGAVEENPLHKGYYWLASEWTNLLWACPVCNSRKYKGNKFPLQPGSSYAYKSKDKLILEAPLLLDPCKDDPQKHIEYSMEGLIRGITNIGEKSIEVYGLKRPELTVDRLVKASEIKRIVETILLLIENTVTLQSNIQNMLSDSQIKGTILKNEGKIIEHLTELSSRRSEEAEYCGMNRYLIKGFCKEYEDNKIFIGLMKKYKLL